MSGETEARPSGWTTDTLREHFDAVLEETDKRYEQRFKDQDAAVKAALAASELASTKADTASEKRFDAVNEFRQTVNDIVSRMMPRSEAEKGMTNNAEKIDAVAARVDKSEGFTRGLLMVFAVIAALGTLVGILVVTFKK